MFEEMFRLVKVLESSNRLNYLFPPTEIYSEGWMLRLVLNWFYNNEIKDHPLAFNQNSRWYSEALLSSKFHPLWRGDNLSESWTHADGVIGQFEIGDNGYGDLKVTEDTTQLIICEAKMLSKYSSGIKNATQFNQVARSIACMSNIFSKNNVEIKKCSIAFYALVPENRLVKEKTFYKYIEKKDIKRIVFNRIEQYREREDYNDKAVWYRNIFIPFLEYIKIENISWESVIKYIKTNDLSYGTRLDEFYQKCLNFNKKYNK